MTQLDELDRIAEESGVFLESDPFKRKKLFVDALRKVDRKARIEELRWGLEKIEGWAKNETELQGEFESRIAALEKEKP